MHDLFPMGIAKGDAFCNRMLEREQLKKNISKSRHTLVASPRRYGKTSLVLKVLTDNKIPHEKIDLSLVSSPTDIRDYIVASVERLLIKLQPSYKKAYEVAKQFLSNFKPKLIIDEAIGAKIELSYESHTNYLQQITHALSSLDLVAKKSNKRAVLFIDEFQQISILDDHETIEASIRSIAQTLENICLIFSGSNRKLLLMMFDDSQRPFFQLCHKLFIDRIATEHYVNHLQNFAIRKWNNKLDEVSLEHIFSLTEMHPYYINLLCDKVWDLDDLPNLQAITSCWENCLTEETHLLTKTLIALSRTQRAFLQLIVSEPITEPTGKSSLSKLNVATRSAAQAYHFLLENDYIYKDSNQVLQLINPLLKYYIMRQLQFIQH